eukprot:1547480-Prorocentrum_lima.AAC.1
MASCTGRSILADAEAIFLITALHGRILHELSNHANRHSQGVAQGARFFRHQLGTSYTKQLLALDHTFA